MTIHMYLRNMNTVPMHGVEPMYRFSSGLYCRTQISV